MNAIKTQVTDSAPGLGSILLGSADPKRLVEWYRTAFDVEPDGWGWLRLGGVEMMPDGRDDVVATNPEPGRFVLNFTVNDAHAAAKRVDEAGTTWLVPLEERDGGTFGTFTDPDGNYLQIIQLAQKYLADKRAQRRAAQGGNTTPFSGMAVNDIPAAKAFYTDVLGFEVTEEHGMIAIWINDETFVLAYPKADHTPAEFTVLNIPVADIEQAVDDLVGRGVQFLRYDGMPVDDRGIMREGGPLIAWFTDPAGNVLSVLQDT